MIEKTKTITILPFYYRLYLVLTSDVTESRILREDILGPYPNRIPAAALHDALMSEPASWIFLPFEADISDVVHEVSHCIWQIMDYIGAKHEDEIMAYYMGWLTHQVCKFLGKCQIDNLIDTVPKTE